jgi:hypothetical protein
MLKLIRECMEKNMQITQITSQVNEKYNENYTTKEIRECIYWLKH